jgi:glutaredoxin-related protein
MNEKSNVAKLFANNQCPHCGKEIIVNIQSLPPVLAGVLIKDDIKNAKEYMKRKLGEMNITDSQKEIVIKWIDNEKNIFGPDDIDDVTNFIKDILTL